MRLQRRLSPLSGLQKDTYLLVVAVATSSPEKDPCPSRPQPATNPGVSLVSLPWCPQVPSQSQSPSPSPSPGALETLPPPVDLTSISRPDPAQSVALVDEEPGILSLTVSLSQQSAAAVAIATAALQSPAPAPAST
ncbi:hypothetical protein CCHR01_07805 [Colletotrichum chrysophilum]|uniref:Uncharacterized protein n=1 Tax=Colletotrichum chrysophilum TaxID=1836956 RepID=A0AAD9AKW9_9PEZI|nr:hypothetical protein CCHR01_07805 [Colletotrichum chrysophilum]